ncbi:MAG: energy-coupling factor transporter transmembrane component T family protein [Candidatus Hodarchaeota archaeon]
MKLRTISFGYIQRNSFIHRLNPLTKFLVLLLTAILIVILVSDIAGCVIFSFLLLGYAGAGISIRYPFSRLRRLISFILLITLIQLIFTPFGTILFFLIPPLAPSIGPLFPITTTGVRNAVNLAFRLINIILASALFVVSTNPSDFAASLTRIGIPYRYSYTLVLALRLVPLFDHETNTVQAAQRTRGIAIDRGLLRGFIRQIRYTFTPLLFSALTRVDALTLAMDGRGFGYESTRTFLSLPRYTWMDGLITILSLFLTGFLLWFFLLVTPLPSIIS